MSGEVRAKGEALLGSEAFPMAEVASSDENKIGVGGVSVVDEGGCYVS